MQKRDGEQEDFPTKTQADDPDAESPARIRQATRCSTKMAGHAEAEEVEKRYRERDDDAGIQDRRVVNHLVPATWKVEEWRERRVTREKRHRKHDAERAEQALEPNGD